MSFAAPASFETLHRFDIDCPTEPPEGWLAARFAGFVHGECPHCFRGIGLHEAESDRYGDPVAVCLDELGRRR